MDDHPLFCPYLDQANLITYNYMPLTPLLPHWQHVANPFSSGPRPRSTKYKSSDGWTDENYVKLMAGQGVEENSIFWTADGLLTFNLEIVVNLKPQGKIKFSMHRTRNGWGNSSEFYLIQLYKGRTEHDVGGCPIYWMENQISDKYGVQSWKKAIRVVEWIQFATMHVSLHN